MSKKIPACDSPLNYTYVDYFFEKERKKKKQTKTKLKRKRNSGEGARRADENQFPVALLTSRVRSKIKYKSQVENKEENIKLH